MFYFDKNVVLGTTLTLKVQKDERIWREFGEILGKYHVFDVESMGSKGLIIKEESSYPK